jgi:hypothetical protein
LELKGEGKEGKAQVEAYWRKWEKVLEGLKESDP